MSDISKFLKVMSGAIGEAYASYNRGMTKEYALYHHIMRSDAEVMIPSDSEMYTFYKDVWDIVDSGCSDRVVLVKKRNNKLGK